MLTNLLSKHARILFAKTLVPVIRNVTGKYSFSVAMNWSHSCSGMSPCPWSNPKQLQKIVTSTVKYPHTEPS